MNYVLKEDLQDITSSKIVTDNLAALRNKTFLVTGATGLVGSMIIRALLAINHNHNTNIKIVAVLRNPEKAQKIFGEETKEIRSVIADITGEGFLNIAGNELTSDIDYIIHTAAITSSKTMVEKPVETIETALVGTRSLLELARLAHARAFLYVSSMEVYGSMEKGTEGKTTEDRLGFIDPLVVRSDYPESKRMCENMCIAYSSEYGGNVKIARLAQTFGAGTLPWEGRVFAQFANAVIDEKDIVLHTKGLSEGNYCYLTDMITGILTILLLGKNRNAYNVVNEKTHCTIADMAHLVAEKIADGQIKVIFDIPENNKYGYAADTKLWLSSKKLEGLGWKPAHDLEDMYRRTIAYLKAEREQDA